MDRVEKRVLRRNTEKLANVIIPFPASNKLFNANVITQLDKENIQVEQIPYKANTLLLSSLDKSHNANAFPELMKIIKDIDPQLAEAIQEEVEGERPTTVAMQESEVNDDHLPVSVSEMSPSLEGQQPTRTQESRVDEELPLGISEMSPSLEGHQHTDTHESRVDEDLPMGVSEMLPSLEGHQHTDMHESRVDEDLPMGVSEMLPSLEGQDQDVIDGPVAVTSPVPMAFTVPLHFDGTSSVTGGTGSPDVGRGSEAQRQEGGLRLECKPTLSECQSLGIVSKMASDWSSLAIYLGLEDKMDRIDDDYRKVREKCTNVLKLWIKGKGRKYSKEPVTWRTLLDTIHKLYPSFADDLRTKFAT